MIVLLWFVVVVVVVVVAVVTISFVSLHLRRFYLINEPLQINLRLLWFTSCVVTTVKFFLTVLK